ncbi:MAG: YitT family protein [Synergistaceae bacterium]|nr:YitT family protein [Synergistaceae bacterium]
MRALLPEQVNRVNKTHKAKKEIRKFFKKLPIVAKAEWRTLITVSVGAVIYTFGVMSFTVPFQFPDSGVTGISVLLNYKFGIPLPLMVSIANIVLLAWAWRELSTRVIIWTIYGVFLVSMLMHLMDGVPFPHTDQKLLIALIGGAIKGYGCGIVFRSGGSLGGLDIVILYLQKKFGVEIGKYSFYFNMFILGASVFVVGVENAMFGLLAVYASSLAIDNTISSFDKRRLIFVITKDTQSVIDYITMTLRRGATVISAHGGYSGDDRPMVMCVLTKRQSVDLKRHLADTQPRAFMVLADASEVVGRGFKSWR